MTEGIREALTRLGGMLPANTGATIFAHIGGVGRAGLPQEDPQERADAAAAEEAAAYASQPALSAMPPQAGQHQLYSRVVLTAEARNAKHIRTPVEPAYGIVVYNAPARQWVTRDGNPAAPVDTWDTIVAVRDDDTDDDDQQHLQCGRILLYMYNNDELTPPAEATVEDDPELDMYRPPERNSASFSEGDAITLNDLIAPSSYSYPRYPDKALIADVFPGTIYMAQSAKNLVYPADCVIRCKHPETGAIQCHLIHSSLLVPYEIAAARAEDNSLSEGNPP